MDPRKTDSMNMEPRESHQPSISSEEEGSWDEPLPLGPSDSSLGQRPEINFPKARMPKEQEELSELVLPNCLIGGKNFPYHPNILRNLPNTSPEVLAIIKDYDEGRP